MKKLSIVSKLLLQVKVQVLLVLVLTTTKTCPNGLSSISSAEALSSSSSSSSSSRNSSNNSSSSPKVQVTVTPCTRICRYNANFFDGQVCIGCFRDTTEIAAWSSMSNVERGFALEEDADRCDTQLNIHMERQDQGQDQRQEGESKGGNMFEAAIDAKELRRQAQSWFDLGGKEGTKKITSSSNTIQNERLDLGKDDADTDGDSSNRFVDRGVRRDANRDNGRGTDSNENGNKNENLIRDDQFNAFSSSIESAKSGTSSSLIDVPNPCKGICQYSTDFWGGQVCLGCLRDTFEVKNWHTFDVEQKIMAMNDIEDRMISQPMSEVESSSEHFQHEHKHQTLNAVYRGEVDAGEGSSNNDEEVCHDKWEEIDIKTQEKIPQEDCPKFNHFLEGNSVLVVPSLLKGVECEKILKNASQIAKNYRAERLRSSQSDEGLVRLPSIDAAKRADKNTTPYARVLDNETDAMVKSALHKAFHFLDQELTTLVSSALLGTPDSSVCELYQSDRLVYSSREPAINVYTTGGKFLAHEDGQKLTILIPLSSPDEFSGGGTAFWSQDSRGFRVEPPSLVLKPTRGSAILFCG